VTRLVARPWYENVGAWATVGVAAAGLGAGVGLTVAAVDQSNQAHATPWADTRNQLNARSAQFEAGGVAMMGLGTAALVGGALWFLLDQPVAEERYDPPLEIFIGPTGFTLKTRL